MTKRIAINGRFSGAMRPTGTQTAAMGILEAVVRNNPGRELVLFADTGHPGVASLQGAAGLTIHHVPFRSWSRMQSQAWEQFALPSRARREGCGILHSPMTTTPSRTSGLKVVATLCDVHYVTHPEWFSWSFRLLYRFAATAGLRRADRVACISEYVREQACAVLGLEDSRTRTIYLGIKALRSDTRPGAGRPYILCVGSLQPHKNLRGAIEAFKILKATLPQLELRIVGKSQAGFSEVPGLAGLLQTPDVRLTGYLDDQALADQYAGAAAFCFPSYEEGFGLPIVEAMSLGTPVVTSTTSCLPEIAGPTAFLANPSDAADIADALRRAISLSEAEREDLSRSMSAWIAKYHWSAIGEAYHKLYEELS